MQTQIQLKHDEIARRAYQIWQAAGCPSGRDREHWLQAEAELRAKYQGRQKPAASSLSHSPAPVPVKAGTPAKAEAPVPAARAVETSHVAPPINTPRPKLSKKSRVTRVRSSYGA